MVPIVSNLFWGIPGLVLFKILPTPRGWCQTWSNFAKPWSGKLRLSEITPKSASSLPCVAGPIALRDVCRGWRALSTNGADDVFCFLFLFSNVLSELVHFVIGRQFGMGSYLKNTNRFYFFLRCTKYCWKSSPVVWYLIVDYLNQSTPCLLYFVRHFEIANSRWVLGSYSLFPTLSYLICKIVNLQHNHHHLITLLWANTLKTDCLCGNSLFIKRCPMTPYPTIFQKGMPHTLALLTRWCLFTYFCYVKLEPVKRTQNLIDSFA